MVTKRNGNQKEKAAPRAKRAALVEDANASSESMSVEPARPDVTCCVAIAVTSPGLTSALSVVAALPTDSGAAVIVLVPDAADADAVARRFTSVTALPVHPAATGAKPTRDRVLVLTGHAAVQMQDGVLHRGPELERPIDAFFRTIATAAGAASIAVVLSGETSDGALGIQSIKAEGGICLAEHDATAAASEMPSAAMATGSVDAVLGAPDLGLEVARLVREMTRSSGGARLEGGTAEAEGPELKRLFAILRRAGDVDFTHYRPTTIRRRIARRMMLYKVSSLAEYVRYLAERPAEIEALYQDILIKVTHFFRDPQTFEALATRVFPEMIRNRERDLPLRIWVPGCSTGEEPYSIAMVLLELMSDLRSSLPVQIFASDASETALEKARSGTYLENIALDVSPERLRRFFTKDARTYQVNKSIRDMCIFAKQDVTRDPPFSKLDLISCRNVLIYLEPILQKKVISMFHYALRSEGRLILGTSETIGGSNALFSLVDKHVKLYAKTIAEPRLNLEYTGGQYPSDPIGMRLQRPGDATKSTNDIGREADRIVMGRYAPAGVVITSDLQIVQFRGQTGAYLEPAPGEASLNLLRMAREGLMLDLRAAVERAVRTDQATRKEGVRVRSEGGFRDVNVEVIPLRDPRDMSPVDAPRRYFLVLFDEPQPLRPSRTTKARPASTRAGEARRVRKLEEELVAAKGYLQAIIDEQEATNEELQSANEEILSSNEELQSINEELETAKEELQSTNEELTTLNEELEIRNRALATSNTDLTNLLASVNIAIVMVSRDLRIRRFTPLAERVLNLIPGDLGRPLGDIKPRFEAPDLDQLVSKTIETGTGQERDVHDREGGKYSMRISPYVTGEGRVDGAVLCMLDLGAWQRPKTAP